MADVPHETVLRLTGEVGPRPFGQSGVVTQFEDATVRNVEFVPANIIGFVGVRSTFIDCEFTGLPFVDRVPIFSRVGQSVYRGCVFRSCDLEHAHIGGARFEQCIFDRNVIDEWFSFAGEFIDCTFIGKITTSKFYGRPWGDDGERLAGIRDVNEFVGNDFTRSDLRDVAFVGGIEIDAQRWPDSPEYVRLCRFAERVRRARRELSELSDPKARKEALAMLTVYSDDEMAEQPVLFAKRTDIPFPSVRDLVWRALERDLPDS